MNEPSTVRDPMAELEALEAKARERTNTEDRIVQLEARLAQLEGMQLSNDVEGKMHHTPGGGTVLELHAPATPSQSGGGGAGGMTWRPLTGEITVAGVIPTIAEITTALAAVYTTPDPDLEPANGDVIVLTVSGVPKFVALVVTSAMTASGRFVRSFSVTVSGTPTTFYAVVWQAGIY